MLGRLAIILVLASPCMAGTTYYVSPTGTGGGTGPGDIGGFRNIMDNVAVAGDTLLCQPGNYEACRYNVGSYYVMFSKTHGTNSGTSWDAPITVKGDPDTTTCLPADWYTRDTVLPAFDSETQAVFGSCTFQCVSTTAPLADNNYYIVLDGLCFSAVAGNIQASAVKVQNCAFRGTQTDRDSTSTPNTAFQIAYSTVSRYGDWTFTDCSFNPAESAVLIGGSLYGPVLIDHCVFIRQASSVIGYQPTLSDATNMLTVRDSRIFYQEIMANDSGTKDRLTITAVDETEPKRIMTLSGDTTYPPNPITAIVYDDSGSTNEIGLVYSFDHSTHVLTLNEALTFDVEVGVDYVDIADCMHGSGFALRSSNFKAERCVINGMGTSRQVYTYGYYLDNVTITDCLFYGSIGGGGHCIEMRFGTDFKFVGNTVCGNRTTTNYDTLHYPTHRYGIAVEFAPRNAAALADAVFSSNIIAGRWDGSSMTGAAALTCNHLYYSGSGTTFKATGAETDATNWGNVTIYNGEPYGSEPTAFAAGGGYFLATDENFDRAYEAAWLWNRDHRFDSSYGLGISSPARSVGDPAYTSDTDVDGNARDDNPDVGAFEYQTPPPTYPTAASSPSPADAATGLTTRTPELSWTGGINSPTHHIYFGATRSDVLAGTGGTDKGTQVNGDTTYEPGTLAWDTTYYWRVDQEITGETTATGPVWTFSIGPKQIPPTYFIGGF